MPQTKKRKERTNDQVIEDSMPQTKMCKPREENLAVAAKIDNRMELERETVKEIVERLLRRKERQVVNRFQRVDRNSGSPVRRKK